MASPSDGGRNERLKRSCPQVDSQDKKPDHLRLANGGSPCAGRVEVYHGEKWGTVDGFGWVMAAAAVVCKELGCGAALSAPGDAHFGEGSGPVVTINVHCRGSESTLRDCQSGDWGDCSVYGVSHSSDAGVICSDPNADTIEMQFGKETGFIWKTNFNCVGNESFVSDCAVSFWEEFSCTHDHDVTVVCSGKQWHLRLEGGGSRCDGRVEIYHDGTWGRLLDDSWTISDGDVICRQLNCGSVISVYNSSQYGEGTGPVWINNVQCAGSETHIWICPHSTMASPSRSSSDVGVLCSDHKQLRLVDGGSSCSGTLEIYRNGNWRRMQDQFWDSSDANVVCRQLGCGPAITAYSSPVYREGAQFPWLKDVQCQGNESHLLKCKQSSLNKSTGNMSDVGVQCSKDVQIRLMEGGSSCAGRVEIYYNGTWGTVCDDSWGLLEADVVCKQLGCGSAVNAASSAPCGRVPGPVWLDEVRCSGKESALWECASSPWGQHDFYHKEDVSILCREHKELRLVNGQHSCEGRVEVFYNGTWGTVCSDSMSRKDAEVICKQLYCGEAVAVDDSGRYEKGSGPIWLDDVICSSQESFLWQCSSPPWGEHDCDHTDDLRVVCSEQAPKQNDRAKQCSGSSPDQQLHLSGQEMRLVGGSSICSGRVEILSNNTWGTVCDDSWDIREASVVCRQLDCGPAVRAVGQAGFGQGAGQIWLDELHCRGSESFLWDCVASSADQSDCNHKEDAGVVCSGKLPKPPIPTPSFGK
eukprot:gi/632984858/ref/XP_007909356.1/ PREDICTED: deleted in malignant brain tumors 1 protein-like [Callorhinchus milii]